MSDQPIFFNLNPVNFFVISGIVQNFILAGILFFRNSDPPKANKLLALTILIVNLHLSYLMVLDTNLDNLFPVALRIPFSFLTAIGPLIFLYTRTLASPPDRLENVAKHFIPVAVEFGLQLIMIGQGVIDDQLPYNTPLYFYVMPLIYMWTAFSIVYYLKKSLKMIEEYELWGTKNFSNLKEITLRWLQKLIVYYRLLWILWIPFVTIFLFFFRFQLQYLAVVLILYVLMLILTYLTGWIGLEGVGRRYLVARMPTDQKGDNKNYSRLSDEEIQQYSRIIVAAMTDDQLYLNENLSLKDLALHIKLDANLVSYLLNSRLNKNFYDFVNEYRIDEVKTRLKDSRYQHLSLLGIALESGFNSKTTFNRVFKQVTGMTPTAFQKQHKK